MGRSRSKYKAKQVVLTDDREQKKIQLEGDVSFQGKYDESNALVLPSKKRTTKKVRDKNAAPVKLLSKRKRKLLEKVVDKKKKKALRSSLLEALQQVQADPKDLAKLTQLQTIQTIGRKKYSNEDYEYELSKSEVENHQGRILSSVKGKKRKITQRLDEDHKEKDPNVVRLGEVSSEEESDSEEESEVEEMEKSEEEAVEASCTNQQDKDDEVTVIDGKSGEDIDTRESKNETPTEVSEQPSINKPATFVSVIRSEDIQKARLRLPILSEEQVIMEAISENAVTVIVGSTGSGKTTQVPQFLYEAGYASNGQMIGITEPRRVAAISMSQRVGHEMNMTSQEVSYQIRFQGNATPDTKIKFMTDGVLLKEIQLDPMLKKYSVIIIDEAHERSIFSDILIGILSRILPIRLKKYKPLKLIIMSATLRVEDFTENAKLFREPRPPVMKVDARMFEVTIHYNKRTADDYLGEAYKKICKIHRQLPDGGILVFLTGQQEVNTLIRKLRMTFPFHYNDKEDGEKELCEFQKRKKKLKEKKQSVKEEKTTQKVVLPQVKLEDFTPSFLDDANMDSEGEDAHNEKDDRLHENGISLDSDDEVEKGNLLKVGEKEQPLYVLPLYSVLSPDKQQLVFQPPPEGTRLCVVATNVAETSLTIPNVKYVVDSGKVKKKVYDKVTGVSMFHICWTSKASANQRAGRAGRTAPGHCYRLYSSAVFEHDFEDFSEAEIQQRPIDDIVLIMKSMNLPVINFPFPTPPDYLQIQSGMKRLKILGALMEKETSKKINPIVKKAKSEIKDYTVVTPLGKAMAAFPLSPRYGKMLALSHQHSLLPYSIAIVSALTIPEVLLETPIGAMDSIEASRRKWHSLRLSWAGVGNSRMLGDIMVLLRAVGAAEYQRGDENWCEKNGLRHKGITEIRKLRRQLTNEINLIIPTCNVLLDPKMPPPTDGQANLLRQIVTAGLVDHVARRVNDWDLKDPEDKVKWKYAYKTQEMEEPVFLPESSVVRVDMPQWVVYQDIYETHKMFMRNVCVIEPKWLAIFAPQLCTFSQPLESPEPRYDADQDKVLCHRSATFGASAWEIPDVEVEYPPCQNLFRWVAYFILIGEMCPQLKAFKEHIYDPKVMVSPVAIRYKAQRESLLIQLMRHDITNLAKLKHVWSLEPSYLQKEYIQWIENEDIRTEVKKIWPPCFDPEKVNIMTC